MAKKNTKSSLSQRKSMSLMQLWVFAAIFGVIGGFISWAAFAAPHKTATGGSTSAATLTAAPNPATAGTKVYLTGCGYDAGTPATLKISGPNNYSQTYMIGMWSTGCLDNAYWPAASTAGTYMFTTYQKSSTQNNATDVFKASTAVVVQ